MEELGEAVASRRRAKGNEHFQAGADLKWINGVRPKSPAENETVSQATFEAVQRLNRLPIPSWASVQAAASAGTRRHLRLRCRDRSRQCAVLDHRVGAGVSRRRSSSRSSAMAHGVRQVRRYALTGNASAPMKHGASASCTKWCRSAELEAAGAKVVEHVVANAAGCPGRNQGAGDGKLVRRHGAFLTDVPPTSASSNCIEQAADERGVGLASFAEKRAANSGKREGVTFG